MTIKTVLGVLDVTKFHKDLESAITFCDTHQAHLTALVVAMGAGPYLGTYDVISTVWVEERQREIDELYKAAETVKSMLGKSEISWDVQDIYTEFAWAADDIAVRALYADIVLVGPQAARDEQFRKQVIDGALFHSPTPILFNPTGSDVHPAPKAVLLAWDSSYEAAHAAQLSIDFLKSAGQVHVALVDPLATSSTNGEEPGADIARYLARHGVNVEVDRISSGGRPIDETLRQHAIDVSADMIVMGAYNHPRLQQRLFGGVTHSMLKEANVPLFLAH